VGIMPKKDATQAAEEPVSCDAVQRVLAAASTATDWKAFFKNRWSRRRPLLPSLALKYPTDSEMQYIAQLAGVRDISAFAHGIESIILDAHLNDQVFRTLTIPKVRKAINAVAKQAKLLKKLLRQLDVGSGSKGSLMEAGLLIEAELWNLTHDRIMQLPEYIVLLDALNAAAERGSSKRIPSQRGAGGNPAFDMFIEQLLMSARTHGGSWTNYRSQDQSWTGTLLTAVGILRKYLPRAQFFPPGELGRSVEHIRDKLHKHIARPR
jgi:hypothetical protein